MKPTCLSRYRSNIRWRLSCSASGIASAADNIRRGLRQWSFSAHGRTPPRPRIGTVFILLLLKLSATTRSAIANVALWRRQYPRASTIDKSTQLAARRSNHLCIFVEVIVQLRTIPLNLLCQGFPVARFCLPPLVSCLASQGWPRLRTARLPLSLLWPSTSRCRASSTASYGILLRKIGSLEV